MKSQKVRTEIIGIQSQTSNGRPDEGDDTTPPYTRVVERYAMFFDIPETRLRFINNTLAKQANRQERLQRRIRRFRFLERTRLYGHVLEARCYSAILEEMRAMGSSLPRERRHLPQRIQAPFSARLYFLLREARHAFYGAAALGSILMFFTLYSFSVWSAQGVNSYLEGRYGGGSNALAATVTSTPNPNNNLFSSAEKIFPAGTENGYEKWSNGCNISTKYETDNHPRSYYTIPRDMETDGEQVSNKIVGILYHTPESYMVEFNAENNKAIQKGSRGLIEHVQKHKKYNYMINRIGDIYRIVRDNQAAYHAGESLWADDKNTYVLLNESFIGVCFESKFEGASSLTDILTPSQIRSGRMLTDVLRTKYGIDDANCTTHGLAAVDPDKMLIARHHDWVRFFPFEVMGLSDKYKIQPPNMTDYGFTYDQDVLNKIGNQLWDGAKTADGAFNKRAGGANVSPEELRRRMRDRYISQRNKVLGLHSESGDANTARSSKKPSGAGLATETGTSQSISDAWKALN